MTPGFNKLLNILLKKKAIAMFLAIDNESDASYCSKLTVKAHCTYAYALDLLGIMEKAGIVALEKRGRIKNLIRKEA